MIFTMIENELIAAKAKFPTWPVDPFHAVTIIGEEFGELQKAILEFVYEPGKCVTMADIEQEAVQLAAMAIRFLENMDFYRFTGDGTHCEATS
jgi:hypothetical protein